MANALSAERKAEQTKVIIEKLAENPDLARFYFLKAFGFNNALMKKLEADGVVKFGKNTTISRIFIGRRRKPQPAARVCNKCNGKFEKRSTESIPEFNERSYCGSACSSAATKKKDAQAMESAGLALQNIFLNMKPKTGDQNGQSQ